MLILEITLPKVVLIFVLIWILLFLINESKEFTFKEKLAYTGILAAGGTWVFVCIAFFVVGVSKIPVYDWVF